MSLEHSPSKGAGEMGQSRCSRDDETLMTSSELEQLLKVAAGWAAKDRIGRALIPHVKIGRAVRYRMADVRAFIAASVR
jgi:hypothetical protein